MVPIAVLDKVIPVEVPLHIASDDGLALIEGVGLTLMLATAEDVHVFAVPIIV